MMEKKKKRIKLGKRDGMYRTNPIELKPVRLGAT